MPRVSRQKSSTQIYHIVVKGADRQVLFEERRDYFKYLELLAYFKEECEFKLYAYCLMSNHVHLLIQTTTVPLETVFRKINTTYACWFNPKYDRTGFLQGGRYFSEPVEDKRYLLTVLRYIHFNPVKAGLENYPGEKYYCSSYKDYINNHSKLTDIDFIIDEFGNLENYIDYHKENTDEQCLDIQTCKRRIPDDVAKEIIHDISGCKTATDFQKLTLSIQKIYICAIHKKGVSIRQLNRLTGTPRGVIERFLKNKIA